jgi:hypothetical protein
LISFLVALQYGIEAFAVAISVNVVLILLLNAHAVKKKTEIGYVTQFAPLALNLTIAIAVYGLCIGYEMIIENSTYITYAGEFVLLILVYVILQYLLNRSVFDYWNQMIRSKLGAIRKKEK